MAGNLTDEMGEEIDHLQNKLRETLRAEEERGANIRGLETRTGNLEQRAGMFQSESHSMRNRLWWKCFKWFVLIAAIVALLVLILYRMLFK